MKVFYLCRTGHHTSLIAAALRLGRLPADPGSAGEIYNIPGFDDMDFKDVGKPYYVGTDSSNVEIYTIGVMRNHAMMARAANDLIGLMGVKYGEWLVIDASRSVSKWTIAGLIFKKLRLRTLARTLIYFGARREYDRLAAIYH